MAWLYDVAAMVGITSLSDIGTTLGIFAVIGSFIAYLNNLREARKRDAKLEENIQRRVDRLKEIFATKNQPHDAFLATKVLAADLG